MNHINTYRYLRLSYIDCSRGGGGRQSYVKFSAAGDMFNLKWSVTDKY